ncbi:GNAT family N-acetyltransferase [Streptomyces mayteni]
MTPLSATDLPVRRLDLADLTACLDLADSRDWTREEHKWRLLLTAGQGYGIDAPAGDPLGGLIATVVVTAYGDDHRCLSMVLVAERYARRGIARHLMRHALAECGPATAFLSATEQGRPLYEQLGFKAVGSLTTIRGTFTGAVPPPTGAASAVRPATAADLPAVLAYDRPVFGADRTGLLTRLPAFADRFLVAADARTGRLAGFAAAWPNPSSVVIGPVVADDTATAQALIARLGAEAGRAVRYDVDARHPELGAWLRANGLGDGHDTTLMVRGAPDIPGDITRRFAPYSVALG